MDFKCTGDNLEYIPEEVVSETGTTFPQAHTCKKSMATLAKALRKHRGDAIARVPFCVTVEAEAFGGHIKLGDGKVGPRVESYVFSSLEEMSSLEGLDITKNRISEVLGAVELLAEARENVVLSVEGPFTIISALIDPLIFYKGMRKDPKKIQEILAIVEEGVIRYSLEGIKRGAKIISYGDPVGAMDIVGPKIYRDFSGPSSWRIISVLKEVKEKVIIHICGKILLMDKLC